MLVEVQCRRDKDQFHIVAQKNLQRGQFVDGECKCSKDISHYFPCSFLSVLCLVLAETRFGHGLAQAPVRYEVADAGYSRSEMTAKQQKATT